MANVPSVNSGHPVWQAAFSAALGAWLLRVHPAEEDRVAYATRNAIADADQAFAVVKAHDAEIEQQHHAAAVEIGRGLLKRKFHLKSDMSNPKIAWTPERFDEDSLMLVMSHRATGIGGWLGIVVSPGGWDQTHYELIEEPAEP